MEKNHSKGKEINPRGIRVEFPDHHFKDLTDPELEEKMREECGPEAVDAIKVVQFPKGRYAFVDFHRAADAGAFMHQSLDSGKYRVMPAFKLRSSNKKPESPRLPPSAKSLAEQEEAVAESTGEMESLSYEAFAADIAKHCRISHQAAAWFAVYLAESHCVCTWETLLAVEEGNMIEVLNLPVGIVAMVKKELRDKKNKNS